MRANRPFLRNMLSASIVIAVAGCASTPPGDALQTPPALFANQGILSNLDIARSEFSRGNYGNAIQYLEKELAQKPASVAALNGLGACYDQLGRYEVAQRYYFRALDLSPESSQTLSNIGYSYLQQGRHREAVAILELALQKNDGNQVAANNLELARSGLVNNALPVEVARSTNNGSQADQMDFLTLMTLIQNAGSTAAAAQAGTAGSTGAAAVSSVVGAGSTATVSTPRAVTSTVIRLRETFDESSALNARNDDLAESQSAVPETRLLAESPGEPVAEQVSQTSPAAEQYDETAAGSLQTEVTEEEPALAGPSTLSPAPEGESAELALVTGQATVIVPTLEPVVGEEVSSAEANGAETEYPQLTLTIIDTPQLDPARVSDMPPAIASLSQPLNLVVENGNGVRGIARATSNMLSGEKLDIKRVNDADHYDYAQTVIYYRPEFYPYAQEIAASLNLSCELLPSDQLAEGADVHVVLGHDFASQVSVENGTLSFETHPNDDYLASTLRLEVANGNGIDGMAARVREYLRKKGSKVVRISDADNFDYQETLLYYRSGTRIAAEDLVDRLPLSDIRLIESDSLGRQTDARLIIGSDFTRVDNLVMN